MKVAILFADPRRRFSAALAGLFTGATAFHCGLYDPADGEFFDISVRPRSLPWPEYRAGRKWIRAIVFDAPNITREQCEDFLAEDNAFRYSWGDYFLFAVRPLYRLFGREARNMEGIICSELVNSWLWRAGVQTPFDPDHAPPSPTDLFFWLSTTGRELE